MKNELLHLLTPLKLDLGRGVLYLKELRANLSNNFEGVVVDRLVIQTVYNSYGPRVKSNIKLVSLQKTNRAKLPIIYKTEVRKRSLC